MTLAGWVFMICSIGFVVSLIVFCFHRVLTTPSSAKNLHAPLEIDTQDRGT